MEDGAQLGEGAVLLDHLDDLTVLDELKKRSGQADNTLSGQAWTAPRAAKGADEHQRPKELQLEE